MPMVVTIMSPTPWVQWGGDMPMVVTIMSPTPGFSEVVIFR